MMRVKFFVPGGMKRSDLYRIVIQAQNDNELFEKTIPGAPDIRNIFLQIDKTIYKPTDTVHLRALPLTTNGKLYNGPVDFSLMNADGFELIHKNKSVINNGFINVEFQVPQHLNFGEWKIIARADRYKPTIKSITFQVQQYEVPPFRLHIMAKETDDITVFELDVLARHANGRAISGQITVLCDCNANKIRSSIPSDSRKFSLCILHSGKDNEA
ncbi:unnamed protein product [Thelazia callipaeda]|uniref:MG2 domain-containing protein n=1 Tax=Thelazia callipaeda TaxID=103827 RepID=A0A0N5D6T5_THECL|nr:unnamed protein product [Thelazia callipaeda]